MSSSNADRVDGGSGRTLLRLQQPYPQPQRREHRVRARRLPVHRLRRRRERRRPGQPGPEPVDAAGQAAPDRRRPPNRPAALRASRKTNPFVGRAGLDQIWAYGLRNPWRWSFDRATGDLWIGDVGQDTWEEVDRAPASHGRDAARGLNFGWKVMEASHCYAPASGCSQTGKTLPLTEYRPRQRPLLDHRRVRLSRIEGPGPRGRLPVRRLLLRARSGTSIAAPPAARPRSWPWTRTR